MKLFITGSMLCLSLASYSQTSIKAQMNGNAGLNQYMWSFTKNKAIPNNKGMIDFDAMDNWRAMGNYMAVSDDGKYFAYTINKMVYNPYAFGLFKVDSLVIQSTRNGQRTLFAGLKPGSFTADSRQYIFQDENALCFLQVGKAEVRKIADVASYKISQDKWLAYQLKGKDSLNVKNLATGKERQFAGIADYDFSNNGDWLIYQNKGKDLSLYNLASGTERNFSSVQKFLFAANGKALLLKMTDGSLQCLNTATGDAKTIWKKERTSIVSYSMDASGKQVAFNVADSSNQDNAGIWYYAVGMDKPVLKIHGQASDIPSGLTIANFSFEENGQYLKLSLQAAPVEAEKPKDELAGVEVWNHKDLNLQSARSAQLNRSNIYNALANIENGKLVLLESDDKKLVQSYGDFALVKKDYEKMLGNRFWEKGTKSNQDSTWIMNLNDGTNVLLPTLADKFWFSPAGNYLVWFDTGKGCHYYSYDLHTGSIKDISANAPKNQLGITERSEGHGEPSWGNLAAWIEKDAGVLVYDNYDIWRLDLRGEQPAVNLTKGFGQSNKIILSLFSTDRFTYNAIPTVKANETLLLRAFNDGNKQGGFCRITVANAKMPELVYMGNYFMNSIGGCHDPNLSNSGMAPIKAKNSNSWIVQRQSTNDAPNYYETTDFKNYRRLTDFQPQRNYQWCSEEVVTFKHLDGKTGQGILYKPWNFDPNKKYPVVIPFYGAFSNNMYQFPAPSYIDQAMETGKSPIWFLNNGYLVFTPDIAVAPLKYGAMAYNVIEGAARYLKTLPYVDGNKLGCGSHSWSGKLGAYMFTHSTSIAATAITEGFLYANPTVQYLSSKNSEGGMEAVEKGMQYGSLWDNKEEWLDQTTVLNADKAVSPLLLLCNHESAEDYQEQTFQFFNALRRLDKNVWWLKYDNGDHTLIDQKELKDYTIRYTQFFDHYLKNAPAPLWMTEGIPYKLKGIEARYELDPKGQCNVPNGEHCPICEAWNKQYARTPEMFKKEIKDWALDKDIADELERKQNEKRKELDKEGEMMNKKILDILKNGYPKDEKKNNVNK